MEPSLHSYSLEEYLDLSINDRCQYLLKEEKIFHVQFSQQFSRPFLDQLYVLTNKIKLISKTKEGSKWLGGLLSTKKVMFYFIQPSTRTFLSFLTAAQSLGIKISDVRSTETSSEMKGESFSDTIKAFSSYFDMIIMRHPLEGYSEKASFILNSTRRPIPVINAGSGKDQHPTQALLDIFTLRKSFERIGGLENKTIMIVGDLKRGRTVRSLCYLLSNFRKIKFIFSSPNRFQMEADIKEFLSKNNISYIETNEFDKWIPEADAVYMTRIQDEYDSNGESKKSSIENFFFTKDHLKLLKPNGVIMHPLPRRQEIAEEVDLDPRAVYWRQVRNGMWTRAALIAYLFSVDKKILDR